MSVKDALISLVEVLEDDQQKKLLLNASQMLQPSIPQMKVVKQDEIAVKPAKLEIIPKKKKPPSGPFYVQDEEFPSVRKVAESYSLDYPKLLRGVHKGEKTMDELVVALSPPETRILGSKGVKVIRRPAPGLGEESPLAH